MPDQLTPADAALRQRITELSVHIPCGMLRGPTQRRSRYYPDLPVKWQSCRHEDNPESWEGFDVSRFVELCVVCFRATAGGPSRWAWLACNDCRAVNDGLNRPFALGRHSLMNGIGVRGGAPPDMRQAQVARLAAFARGDDRLNHWRRVEYARLASRFAPDSDVPWTSWQREWPARPDASRDAFDRLMQLR